MYTCLKANVPWGFEKHTVKAGRCEIDPDAAVGNEKVRPVKDRRGLRYSRANYQQRFAVPDPTQCSLEAHGYSFFCLVTPYYKLHKIKK
jgi:hypothetical protein